MDGTTVSDFVKKRLKENGISVSIHNGYPEQTIFYILSDDGRKLPILTYYTNLSDSRILIIKDDLINSLSKVFDGDSLNKFINKHKIDMNNNERDTLLACLRDMSINEW
ncbi:MAG: hypothetical protein WC175_04250 [Candidatus Dojkabacteria bacterium]